jgi:hypothetical protein
MRKGVVKVDAFKHAKTGIAIPIYLNKETGQFRAEHADNVFHDALLEKLKEQLNEYCERINRLDWIPVIEVVTQRVEKEEPDEEDPEYYVGDKISLTVQFSRFMLAWAGGKFVSTEWKPDIDWLCRTFERDNNREPNDEERMALIADHRRNNCKDFRYFGEMTEMPPFPYTHTVDEERYYTNYEIRTFLAYSTETWQGLENLRQCVRMLKGRLNEILISADGIKKISSLGGTILIGGGSK